MSGLSGNGETIFQGESRGVHKTDAEFRLVIDKVIGLFTCRSRVPANVLFFLLSTHPNSESEEVV